MPPPAFLNVSELNPDKLVYTREQIYQLIPQRYEFEQLHGIIHLDTSNKVAACLRDIHSDEWWCRGHLPGRPIFPGVLMLECAAQLAAFYREITMPSGGAFMGFGGVDNAKFRGAVIPPARMIVIGRAVEERERRFVCDTQGYIDGAMIFECRITGMPIRN
jgi:3-hydroxyacyl-[acyl-carrier-protein] dehydratase